MTTLKRLNKLAGTLKESYHESTQDSMVETDGNDIFPPMEEGPGFNKANPQRKLEDELTTSMANALRAGMLPQDVKAAVQSALGTAVKIWTIEDEKANADTLGEPKF